MSLEYEKEKDTEAYPSIPILNTRGRGTHEFIIEGDTQFIGEKGGNGAETTYQDVSGAPVESDNPLGYNVGWWSALFLNITMIIGTGIFSFRMFHLPGFS